MELAPDEAYYWEWSRHLSGGYFDHPPMIAWIIGLTSNPSNPDEFWTRFPALAMGLGGSLLLFRFARELFPEHKNVAVISVLGFNLPVLFSVGQIIITPDTPLMFFWTLSLFFLYRALIREHIFWWLYCGLALGLAFLSKYTATLFIPCLIGFLYFSKRFRPLLGSAKPWFAIVVALLIFSPTIIWNMEHDWVSFRFQLSHGFSGKPVQPLSSFFEFIGSQVLLITPFVFATMAVAMVYCYREWSLARDDRCLFLFSFCAPILLFFAVVSLKNKVEGNWPAMAYITAVLALAGFFSNQAGNSLGLQRPSTLFLRRWCLLTSGAVFIFVHVHATWNLLPLQAKWDPLVKRAHGWKVLGERAGLAFHELDHNITFVFGHRHGIASEIAFYLPGNPRAYRVHGSRRFAYRNDAEKNHLIGANGLYVVQDGWGDLEEVHHHFESVEELTSVPITFPGGILRTFRLFVCRNYKGGLIEA